MAITRLKDLVTVFQNKWTFGDAKFGYDGEVNESHSTQYPLLLINPPLSTMPEIYNGREEYEFEINFYNLYPQAAQSAVTLQHRWDNLQDLAMEWFDMVLKNYQDNVVDVYLNDESVEIERVKEVANDRLVQIKFTFTMSAFSKCFRPVSTYPSDIANLVTWLRADSGLTFDIPTKKISAWADFSGNNNGLEQGTKTKQPIRFGHDGANDKARINFNGTTDLFNSVNNLPISTEFTIFQVSQSGTAFSNLLSYTSGATSLRLSYTADHELLARISDGTTSIQTILTDSNALNYHIGTYRLQNKTLHVDYDALGSSLTTSVQDSAYDNTTTYNSANYNIGATSQSFNGNLQEFIIFNSSLDTTTIEKVKTYLNNKYKIY
tara:strand:+ start:1043 stop:2176 length:1134 start_codon:yes stop_codon:yes gene_type:complete